MVVLRSNPYVKMKKRIATTAPWPLYEVPVRIKNIIRTMQYTLKRDAKGHVIVNYRLKCDGLFKKEDLNTVDRLAMLATANADAYVAGEPVGMY